MPSLYLVEKPEKSTLVLPHTTASLEPWLAKQDEAIRTWVRTNEFTAKPQTHLRVPAEDGGLDYVLAGIEEKPDLWSLAGLPAALPEGVYRIDTSCTPPLSRQFALGWLLGCYEFSAYKKEPRKFAALALPAGCDAEELLSQVEAIALVRDLVNTPAEDMGPTALADAAQRLAKTYGASCKILSGSALLKHNYPAIHAVGRASDEEPCLVDIHWGNPKAPKVTLVGKGVCFDSGGLDIKTAAGMELMKKDMGGAAHVLGLARMLMDARVNIRLRVLIPAVENSISGNAFRPGDVLRTRKGLTVEIGNTDAEGRLILCDALTEADSEKPDLLIDCATLTGAARVGLGTDVPAVFSRNDSLAKKLVHIALGMNDPLWQLPLWHGYRDQIDSSIADLNNSSPSGYGGAITAALFLNEFVTDTTNWIHVDMMAWNVKPLPGRPKGGEAMGLRALFALISEKFSA